MKLPILTAGLLTAVSAGCTPNQPAPAPAVDTGEACKLSPSELAARRKELIPGLFARAGRVEDIPDGLRFRFASRPGLMSDLARVVERERDCCSFLRFRWPRSRALAR